MPPECECSHLDHAPRLVVLTGGPGAGKTAVLEVVRRHFCRHVLVLPESAGLLFSGGFPRRSSLAARTAAQRAIFRVQRELERMAIEERAGAVILCDRGTLDGLAYWPPEAPPFLDELGVARAAELARYAAVIHLRTPRDGEGYDLSNPLRRETAAEAAAIDARIVDAWAGHPARIELEPTVDFLHKLERAVATITEHVPACCRQHLRAPG